MKFNYLNPEQVVELQSNLIELASKAPTIIDNHLYEHAKETEEGKCFEGRTNRFKALNDCWKDSDKLLAAQAIMFQTLTDMFHYDEELFEEYLVILDREAKLRNS